MMTAGPARHTRRRALLTTGASVVLGLALLGPAQPASATGAGADGGGRRAAAACMLVAWVSGDFGPTKLNPRDATFSGGTYGDDMWSMSGPAQPGEPTVVWCGFAGDDVVSDSWGWVYGGWGDDSMGENWLVFKGGPGNDSAGPNEGYFNGGLGNDVVIANHGTFYGGPGNDMIISALGPPNMGLFNGGPGSDQVGWNAGTFNGGTGNDIVGVNEGTFDGGPGYDIVKENHGTCINVESGC